MQRWPHISCRFNCQDTLIDSPSKAAWCISFFGIHPTLTHVPPRPQADPLIQAPKFKVKKKSLVNPGTRSVGTEQLKIYSTEAHLRGNGFHLMGKLWMILTNYVIFNMQYRNGKN